jgi:hypothetical protein
MNCLELLGDAIHGSVGLYLRGSMGEAEIGNSGKSLAASFSAIGFGNPAQPGGKQALAEINEGYGNGASKQYVHEHAFPSQQSVHEVVEAVIPPTAILTAASDIL